MAHIKITWPLGQWLWVWIYSWKLLEPPTPKLDYLLSAHWNWYCWLVMFYLTLTKICYSCYVRHSESVLISKSHYYGSLWYQSVNTQNCNIKLHYLLYFNRFNFNSIYIFTHWIHMYRSTKCKSIIYYIWNLDLYWN